MKNIYKYIIIVVCLIVIAAIIFLLYKNQSDNKSYHGNGEWFISFDSNYIFKIPDGYNANANTNPGTTIVIDKNEKLSYPNVYAELLLKNAVVIQLFVPLNQDDALFEKYIKEVYKKQLENENNDIEIEFEKLNKNKIATITVSDNKDQAVEVIKIINFQIPIVLASSSDSAELKSITASIAPIENIADIKNIKNKILLIGSLVKTQYIDDLYNQFSESGKEKNSKDDLNKMLAKSQKSVTFPINLYGGKFEDKGKKFSCILVFTNPDKPEVLITSGLTLEKVKNEWLIKDLKLPEDTE